MARFEKREGTGDRRSRESKKKSTENLVFISYRHDDKEWVRGELQDHLDLAGIEYLIDHEDMKGGENIKSWIVWAVGYATLTIMVLSPAYLEGTWTDFEKTLAMTNSVPIILVPCKLTGELLQMKCIDFTGMIKPWKELIEALE